MASSFARGGRRRQPGVDYWPGFVDALSTLVLVVVFLLSVFSMGQFFLAREVVTKDDALTRLNRRLAELTDFLALESGARQRADAASGAVSATLEATRAEADRLRGLAASSAAEAAAAGGRAGDLRAQLDTERAAASRAATQLDVLNGQIAALRRQLAALEEALNASEAQGREGQARLAELGSRLNVALAQRVQELARYRSDFFGRLRAILGERPGIRVVGDRFVFQSEVLFAAGSADLGAEGRAELDKLAEALKGIAAQIPPDIAWVARIDGHTDRRPLSGAGAFASNWELSATRAVAVVQELARRGVPATNLLAAGFGEFQPLEAGDTEEAYRRNRRIEVKLTER